MRCLGTERETFGKPVSFRGDGQSDGFVFFPVLIVIDVDRNADLSVFGIVEINAHGESGVGVTVRSETRALAFGNLNDEIERRSGRCRDIE